MGRWASRALPQWPTAPRKRSTESVWLQSVPRMPNHHLTQDEMYALAAFIMSLRKEQ
jgi:hypothetical protein